jgi:membrane protein YdbS with pleckstrin-like domain
MFQFGSSILLVHSEQSKTRLKIWSYIKLVLLLVHIILICAFFVVTSPYKKAYSELIVAYILAILDSLNVLFAWIKWNRSEYDDCDSVSLEIVSIEGESGESV